MSRTLLLLRHAKASQDSESGGDHDRPLAKRGLRDAKSIAAVLRSESLKPDLTLCSTALRTRQTAAAILAVWPALNIQYEDNLYLASVTEALKFLRRIESAHTALLIGHNPMIENMLQTLVDRSLDNDTAGLHDAAAKYPTGALSELDLKVGAWSELEASCGRLVRFVKPRTLSGESV